MSELQKTLNKKLILIFVCALGVLNSVVFAAQASLQPQIAISPPRLEMHPETEKSNESITVLNMGSSPMQVQISTNNWDLDEENKYRAIAPTEQSLDQWLIVNPVRLTIPAKSQQTVRLAIRPRAKPEAGEHRAMVFFKQLADPKKKGQINFNVGVPIYAYYGEVKRTADVHSVDFDFENNQLVFALTNTGNAYVRPQGQYLLIAKKNATSDEEVLALLTETTKKNDIKEALINDKLNAQPVLAGETRKIINQITLDPAINEPFLVAVKVEIAGSLIEKVFRIENK